MFYPVLSALSRSSSNPSHPSFPIIGLSSAGTVPHWSLTPKTSASFVSRPSVRFPSVLFLCLCLCLFFSRSSCAAYPAFFLASLSLAQNTSSRLALFLLTSSHLLTTSLLPPNSALPSSSSQHTRRQFSFSFWLRTSCRSSSSSSTPLTCHTLTPRSPINPNPYHYYAGWSLRAHARPITPLLGCHHARPHLGLLPACSVSQAF